MLCRLLFLPCRPDGNGVVVVVVVVFFLSRLDAKVFCIILYFLSFLTRCRYQSKFSIAINGFNNSVKWKWIYFSSTSSSSTILLLQMCYSISILLIIVKIIPINVHGEITRHKGLIPQPHRYQSKRTIFQ